MGIGSLPVKELCALSLANEAALLAEPTKRCACYHCLRSFLVDAIEDWACDTRGHTALCPQCGIDSIVPGEHSQEDLIAAHDKAFKQRTTVKLTGSEND